MTQSVETIIRGYIEVQFMVSWQTDFTSATNLFQAGIMDSFGYVQLVEFLQTRFGFTFNDEEILTNVMVSLETMVAAVSAKGGVAV